MMRKIKAFIILLLLDNSVGVAQNVYRVGDVLQKQQIDYTPCSEYEGRGLTWTMSKPKNSNIYKVRMIANKDTGYLAALSKIEAGTNYLYDVRHDTLLCMGYKNKRAHIKYMTPLPCFHSPIRYGEAYSGKYYGQGIDNKDSFVQLFGSYHTKVSGEGTLITMDGDTLKGTLLLRSQRTMLSRFVSKDSILQKYKDFALVPVMGCEQEKDSSLVNIELLQWYAPGFRYPVWETLSVYAIKDKEHPIVSTAFYYAIDDQANLQTDEGKREESAKHQGAEHGKARLAALGHTNHLGQVVLLDDGSSMAVEYELASKAEVSFAIYNTSGMMLMQRDMGFRDIGIHAETIPMAHIANGNYIFMLKIDGESYSQQIMIKNNP